MGLGRAFGGLFLVVLALLACKGGGGGSDGTYAGACTGTTKWDFDLDVSHDQCKVEISGGKVKIELKHSSSQYVQYACAGTLNDDKVDGECTILDGRGQLEVAHCLENRTYPTFTVRKQGDKVAFEVEVRGTRSDSHCPPTEEKLTGYRLRGELAKK